MVKELVRKISNVVIHTLNRALSVNEEDEPNKVQESTSAGISSSVPISILNDLTMLKIFQYLSIPELIYASTVCKRWHHLSFDGFLWKNVDLGHFAQTLHDIRALEFVINSYLAHKVEALDLSGFTVSHTTLRSLAYHCPDLRKLVLKSVTFSIQEGQDVVFPADLEHLDIRYSHGHPAVYKAMTRNLSKVKWLGLCDAFVLVLASKQTLQQTVSSLESLEKLDLTHCNLAKDEFVEAFGVCRRLKVLCLRKCTHIGGEFLSKMIPRLSCLETLILHSTSVEDDPLNDVDWTNTKIKYLDIGGCPLISSTGLHTLLSAFAQMPFLEYLGLCRVGEGKALTNVNLKSFATQLHAGSCPALVSLNLSFSDNITDEGVQSFQKTYLIETLDVTNCLQITIDDVDDVFELANERKQSVSEQNDNVICTMNDEGQRATRKRSRGSFSTVQFALSNYALETPL